MSILIKGMEMPTSCYKCPLRRRDGMDIVCPVVHERFSVADVNILDYRLDDCPLVPVPPHGRLGDLDALKERATKRLYASNHGSMAEAYFAALIDLIDTAPTIIPASGGQDTKDKKLNCKNCEYKYCPFRGSDREISAFFCEDYEPAEEGET